YGPLVLDLELRFRVHALMDWLKAHPQPGIIDLTPGIRSLQLHFDARRTERSALLAALIAAEDALPAIDDMAVPSRTVYLPLSWDDPATKLAIEKYMQSVRKDAPWCPSNIEFIRRINGLDSIDEVYRTVFEASYLVLGLGDVYLGAPVATPMDPRHRLVTTKYNPARTWTPENAVGIGGAYMCVYGMEGPGGYQFVGRTVQMWNRWHHGARGTGQFDKPWLLRFFDQVRFVPVSEAELLQLRKDFAAGRAGCASRKASSAWPTTAASWPTRPPPSPPSRPASRPPSKPSGNAGRPPARPSTSARPTSPPPPPTPSWTCPKAPAWSPATYPATSGRCWSRPASR
uniref:carboxyltransferase domain-containing protein n=1 Tax=Zoogloea sp. TaxID=49181 RepID=UPI002BBF1EEE